MEYNNNNNSNNVARGKFVELAVFTRFVQVFDLELL